MKKIVVLLIAAMLSSLSVAAPAPQATVPGLPQTLDEYVNQVFGPEPLKAIAGAKKGERLWFIIQSKRESTTEFESGMVRILRFKLEKECWRAKLDCQIYTLPRIPFPCPEPGTINIIDPAEYSK